MKTLTATSPLDDTIKDDNNPLDDQFSTSSPGNESSSADNSSNTSPHGSDAAHSTGGERGTSIFHTSREDRQILGAKCVFLSLLMVAAAALATTVYYTTSNEEQQDFEVEFINMQYDIDVSSNQKLLNVFDSLETLSKTTTAFIMREHEHAANSSSYPSGFVTIPNAEYILANAREESGASILLYTPIVQGKNYNLWTSYVEKNLHWLEESWSVYPNADHELGDAPGGNSTIETQIWRVKTLDSDGHEIHFDSSVCYDDHEDIPSTLESMIEDPETDDILSPIWIVSPPPSPQSQNRINFNLMSLDVFNMVTETVADSHDPTLHDICKMSQFFQPASIDTTVESIVVVPVFEDFTENAAIVGHYLAVVPWYVYFQYILPLGTAPLDVVMESSCGHVFSFEIVGQNASLTSPNTALYDGKYEDIFLSAPYASFADVECFYTLKVYPTYTYESQYKSSNPLYYMSVVLAIFIATSLAFLIFDCLVSRRQISLVQTARKQNALVSSLFPKSIQKKLLEEMEEGAENSKAKWNKSGTAGLRSYLNNNALENKKSRSMGSENGHDMDYSTSKPIADLFPETTIMFADIAGFTAWSSTREPSHVFTLLECVYAEFDTIAKRRRVFKVEVVGDCYVAVTGLPDPRPDHAVVMVKFANDCLNKMHEVTRQLEVELGPDTTELGLRIGLHSGPVVAGVLRGDKSRFQLFGDTMNTASRMESNGVANRIQISQDTATLLITAGKEKWIVPREQKITAKGKGELTTYFINMSDSNGDDKSFGSLSNHDEQTLMDVDIIVDAAAAEEKRNRVAEWTVEVLASALKAMVGSRKRNKIQADSKDKIELLEQLSVSHSADKKTVMTEVATYIVLPEHSGTKDDDSNEALDPTVMEELRNYVQTIASLYNDNPFHCFDHANHVVMSVNKLLSRITAPDLDVDGDGKKLHDHTYGITSDPLTWFACVFSALIHDVDHSGVPNAQLVKECAPVAQLYHGKSVAEQNSFDIAWDLLMEPTYTNLRHTIYVTEGEFKRFRQLVVNSVMATDIVDPDMKKLRNDRWDAVFKEDAIGDVQASTYDSRRMTVLKATIVIEHLIQASDVAHTMQHWHIYRRWNERFFKECYQAYLDGRSETNPAKTWYQGEIGFFDFYIIPLAKKLKECGVFGVSSDEYLSYALQNRKEWEERGEEMVKEMVYDARRTDRAIQRCLLKQQGMK